MKRLLLSLALAGVALAATDPTPVTQTASGSISTAGTGTDCSIGAACVEIQAPSSAGTAAVQLSGTFSATLQFETSVAGVTWVAASPSSATSAGVYSISLGGAPYLRVRASSYSSGAVTVAISTSSSTGGGTTTAYVAKGDQTGLTANLGSTALYTASQGGMYRASCYVVTTQAATSSSTMPVCEIGYTDLDSAAAVVNWVGNTSSNNYVGNANGEVSVLNVQAGSAITYLTTSYASSGTSALTYAVHIKLDYLGQ